MLDQAIILLHCCLSGNAASSHSSIFLHLRCHFRNVWYSPSLTVQSILGPSIYGMNVPDANCGCVHGLTETSGSCSWSELDSLSWLLSIGSSCMDTVASTWAELFIALGISNLYQNWVGLFWTAVLLITLCRLYFSTLSTGRMCFQSLLWLA